MYHKKDAAQNVNTSTEANPDSIERKVVAHRHKGGEYQVKILFCILEEMIFKDQQCQDSQEMTPIKEIINLKFEQPVNDLSMTLKRFAQARNLMKKAKMVNCNLYLRNPTYIFLSDSHQT